MGRKRSHVELWGVCSRLVSLRRRQGVSAAAWVQPSGPRLAEEFLPGRTRLGGGSLHRFPVPADLPSSFFRHAGLAPSHLSASALALPPLLAPLPDPCFESPLFFTRRVGVRLRPPALLTCNPCPLWGLVVVTRVFRLPFRSGTRRLLQTPDPGQLLQAGASFASSFG